METGKLNEIITANGNRIIFFGEDIKGSVPSVKIMLEPVTMTAGAAILWEIGKGILAAIGGKVFAALINDKQDLEALMRDLVNGIRDVVKQAIDENEFQNCLADIQSFKVLMTEYLTSPKTRAGTLNKIVDDAMFPVSRIERLEKGFPVTAQAYIMAGMFRLTALQEFAKRSGDKRDFKNFTDFAKIIANGTRAAIPSLVSFNEARVSMVSFKLEHGGCRRIADDFVCRFYHTWSYTVDGAVYSRTSVGEGGGADDLGPDVERHRQDDLKRIRDQFQTAVMDPLNHSIGLLDQIAQMQPKH